MERRASHKNLFRWWTFPIRLSKENFDQIQVFIRQLQPLTKKGDGRKLKHLQRKFKLALSVAVGDVFPNLCAGFMEDYFKKMRYH